MMALSEEDSQRYLALARAAAVARGARVSVSVVDAAGHLLAFSRQDGALLASIEVSQVKARTAVYFGTETANLPFAQPFTPALLGASSQPFAFVPGGVPIRQGGKIVGAVGVGGGSAEQDQAIATAAAQTKEGE